MRDMFPHTDVEIMGELFYFVLLALCIGSFWFTVTVIQKNLRVVSFISWCIPLSFPDVSKAFFTILWKVTI